ncbi:hypothetical protein B0A48_05215 [Cryoendolithus antarcticus]|uniref:DUF7918 domain-containing protein n=1 Tax=Cryoendolithus antarcticus TaxID=1507870 RepID=A0A1V8THW4_9PEZI|nr:hypothetical protein B0A48_05215 [Cryoendolithus antarcticus]
MIADFLPGVSISVSIDDRPLREYAADTPVSGSQHAGNTTTAYIEASPDANFKIDYAFLTAYPFRDDDILIRTFIDGEKVCRWFYDYTRLRQGLRTSLGDINSGGLRRKLKFAPLDKTEARPATNAKDTISELGEIRIAIYRCRKSPLQAAPTPVTPTKQAVPANAPSKHLVALEVSEKALKGRAISCRAGLGDAVPVPVSTSTMSRPATVVEYPYGDQPIATYRFLYRSHRDLQIEQIIERSPTPPPLEERDVDTLTVEEARELAKRLKARQAMHKVKPEVKGEKRSSAVISISDDEHDDLEADADVSFTSAQSCRKKVKVNDDVEVVDLS